MPDGSLPIVVAPYTRMYARLIEYGLCYLRGGKGLNTQIIKWESDIRVADRIEWSRPQIESAARLHSAIIRLPLAHNLVLQVFFNEACALFWDEIEPEKQNAIVRDLTLWPDRPPGLNTRIRRANREWGTQVQPIHWMGFIPLRDEAIHMLCNRERRGK